MEKKKSSYYCNKHIFGIPMEVCRGRKKTETRCFKPIGSTEVQQRKYVTTPHSQKKE
jgi:hypothetical protein